ncbi:MAG TPA: hypothetical protein VNO22_00260 [Planctomycetota bacterium]|nr:hypothetical protein [Planctomycetota bacterium]
MRLRTHGIKAFDQDLVLERRLILSAPNASGKSTVAEALRFLALGYVPALGRRPQDTALLMRGGLMSAHLTLDDGRWIARSLQATPEGYRSRAECSWLSEGGVERHGREILRLFGRDELDVAESLDIRRLLEAPPAQREARIAALLAAGTPSAGEVLREALDRASARVGEAGRDLLEAYVPRLARTLREGGLAAAIEEMGEERRRIGRELDRKTQALREAEERLSRLPEADPERTFFLEAEKERLERERALLEAQALLRRTRREKLEALRAALEEARRAEEAAEAARRDFEARRRAGVPRETAPEVPSPEVEEAERALRAIVEEEERLERSPWSEAARIAAELQDIARRGASYPLYRVLALAGRLSQLAEAALRESKAELRRRRALGSAEAERRRRRAAEEARRRALEEEDRRTAAAVEEARRARETLETRRADLEGDPEPEPPGDPARLHQRLHEIRRELGERAAAGSAWRERDRLEGEAARLRAEREAVTALEGALARRRDREVSAATEGPLLRTMIAFLRAAGREETPFFEAGAGRLRVGWRTPADGEVPAQALSGGEWCLFSAALTAAVLLVRGAPLRILIVEAGEADDATLRALRAGIRAVSDELTAALLLTPRDVAAGDGWTVYRAEARPVAAGPSA